jgi:hypothetical protein
MTYGHIEDLKFAVEVFDEGGNLIEVLARLRDPTPRRLLTRPAEPSIRNDCCTCARAGGFCAEAIGNDAVEDEDRRN